METFSFVYILASEPYGTLYVGVTSNLVKRVFEHREGLADGFTKQHWKVNLIQRSNPDWRDLYDEIVG